jgi:hypothetical protein
MSNRGYTNKAKSGAHAVSARRCQFAYRARLAKRRGKTLKRNIIPAPIIEIEVPRGSGKKKKREPLD